VAAGLAVTAAALVAAGPHAEGRPREHPDGIPRARAETAVAPAAGPVASPPHRRRPPAATVTAPVRIADGATVRLLRPGDRVDVIAADGGGAARVVASGARVTGVPEPPAVPGVDATRAGAGAGPVPAAEAGALVVLSVPRADAARLAGAGAAGRLAVTLW
jgi:hypothetical protein